MAKNQETVELVAHRKELGDVFFDFQGIEWVRLKVAAERVGETKRNLQHFVNPDKGLPSVPGKQFADSGRAPWYVNFQALDAFMREWLAKELDVSRDEIPDDYSELVKQARSRKKGDASSETLPSLAFVWEEQLDLAEKLNSTIERAARAEGENSELRRQLESHPSANIQDQMRELEDRLTKQIAEREQSEELDRLKAENERLRTLADELQNKEKSVVDVTEKIETSESKKSGFFTRRRR